MQPRSTAITVQYPQCPTEPSASTGIWEPPPLIHSWKGLFAVYNLLTISDQNEMVNNTWFSNKLLDGGVGRNKTLLLSKPIRH